MVNFKSLFSFGKQLNYNLNYDFESINFQAKSCNHVVVFTGGKAQCKENCALYFKNCPKPDFVIAADSGLEILADYKSYFTKIDLSPDAILGDMDSLKNKKLLKEFSKTAQIEKFNPYKDFTDTELALILASKVKSQGGIVTLIGGGGGRIDHLIAIFDLFSSPVAPDFWISDSQLLIHLKKDKTVKLLPKKASSPVSVMRTTASNTKGFVESHGLEWESEKFRKIGMPSVSNVISASNFMQKLPVEMTARDGDFVVAVDVDCKIM